MGPLHDLKQSFPISCNCLDMKIDISVLASLKKLQKRFLVQCTKQDQNRKIAIFLIQTFPIKYFFQIAETVLVLLTNSYHF